MSSQRVCLIHPQTKSAKTRFLLTKSTRLSLIFLSIRCEIQNNPYLLPIIPCCCCCCSSSAAASSMAAHHSTGIQGQTLEITVVGCIRLKDTEWISRQDPYVCLEYGGNRFRTRTCTDGGKNPTFNEKFSFPLIEGLREISVAVWNSNTLTMDDFIGSGRIQLDKVLSQGFDDCGWSLQTKRAKYAGEVRVIMHYANAKQSAGAHHSTPQPYGTSTPVPPPYAAPPPAPFYQCPPPGSYSGYAPPPAYPSYPPSPYAPQGYAPPAATYPPSPYPQQPYPVPSNPYPPSAPYQGIYPPPRY